MNVKTNELFQNKEFLEKVLKMEPEKALQEFEKEGSDITLTELESIGRMINKEINNNGELDVYDLDQVAGGGTTWNIIKFASGVAVGVAIVCAPW